MTDPAATMRTLYCLGFGLKYDLDATKALALGPYVPCFSAVMAPLEYRVAVCPVAGNQTRLQCPNNAAVSCWAAQALAR
jgi:hypothetical protein